MLHFGGEELNRQRQPRRGQDLLVDTLEDLLRGLAACLTLAEGPKEVGLLDVLFAIKNDGGHAGMIASRRAGRVFEARQSSYASDYDALRCSSFVSGLGNASAMRCN